MIIPHWIFWMMLLLIIFLIAVILIRDKGIREGLKQLFSLMGKRFQHTKAKLALQKEKEKMAALLLELGKKVAETNRYPPGSETIQTHLKDYRQKENQLDKETETLLLEIKQLNHSFEQFNQTQINSLEEQENLKAPLVEQVSQLKKERTLMEKETGNKEKLKIKHEKKIVHHQERLTEIAADPSLSKVEKQNQTRELKTVVTDLEQQVENLNHVLEPLYEKRGNPAQRMQRLTPRILEYDRQIKQIKDERKRREKEFDAQNKAMQKQKENLLTSKKRLLEQAEIQFKKLGEAANENRYDDPRLSIFHTRLDQVKAALKRLQRQLRT